MGLSVDYLINLGGDALAMAAKFDKAFGNLKASARAMGAEANKAEAAVNALGGSMGKVAGNAEKAGKAMGAFTKANSRGAQDAARANDLWFASQNRVEKMQTRILERQEAHRGLREKGLIPPERGGGGSGLGFMGGMFALSMLHNDVLKNWTEFDDQFRKLRGTLAGQISEQEIGELRRSAFDVAKGTRFSADKIADIFLEEASRGVPVNQRTKDGRLLGAVIAKQMLGIATATGEDPSETFKTHLAIQRGFEMPFSQFPHISDTIARIHQKTGISLKQIETQMATIAAPAHLAGWSEEETAASLGFFAKRGMGNQAGAGIARLIDKSLNWTKPSAAIWKSLGIKHEDLINQKTGGIIGPEAMVRLLKDHTKGMRKADVMQAFNKLFGYRGERVAAALASSDPAEIERMIIDLQNVDGLAEKLGIGGSKGGAAGLAKFTAAWKNLHDAIGESGFGDQVGAVASKFGDLFDTISGGPNWAKEAAGWTAAGLNMLSSAAMPLMALQALGGFRALGAIFRGGAWLTGVSQLKNLGSALAMFAVDGVGGAIGGVLRLTTGLGRLAAGAMGLSRLATSMSLIATAGRLLLGLTGIGAALIIADVVWQNWDKVAAAAERAWKAIKQLSHGDTSGVNGIANDVAKKIGIEQPKDARITQPHGRFGPGFHGFGAYHMSGADALSAVAPHFRNVQNSYAHAHDVIARAQQAIRVNVMLSPLEVRMPASVRLEGTLQGNGVSANVSGSIPTAATAPRGTATAEGSYGHVR